MATSLIKYHGGPVYNKYRPQIYNIFWGSEWNSTSATHTTAGTINPTSIRNELTTAFNAIYASDHWKGLWQYGNIKTPAPGSNIVYTGTAPPGGQTVTNADMINAIRNAMTSGLVPDPNSFGESTAINGSGGWGLHDFQHMYVIFVPPNKTLGAVSGLAARVRRTASSGVWFSYCLINLPAPGSSTGYSIADWAEQTWTHEIVHNLTDPGVSCVNGIGGYRYSDGTQCVPLNHTIPGVENCYGNAKLPRPLVGTDHYVDWYWSDADGKCIAPGTGISWTPPPTPPPPAPVPPGSPPPAPPPPVGSPQPPTSETFEKLWVPFSNTTQIIHNTSPGFSVFCRIFPYTISRTSAGHMRCIWIKQDDKNNGAHALLGDDGSIYFNVKKDNIRYKIKTPPNVIAPNAWFQVWFTFNKQTNGIDIYVNNVRYSDPSTITEAWNDRHSHFIIGNYDTGSAIRPFRGRVDDFRLYRNGVVSSGSVGNMWENQYTIETIPVTTESDASVAIAGFVVVDEPLVNTNFTVGGVVDPTILPPSPPTPPPPPPGTDDKPLPPPPPEPTGGIGNTDEDIIIGGDTPAPPPTPNESDPEPIICDPPP